MNFQSFTEMTFAFRVTPGILVFGGVFSMVLGLVGGAWPAWRAARMSPTQAMRASERQNPGNRPTAGVSVVHRRAPRPYAARNPRPGAGLYDAGPCSDAPTWPARLPPAAARAGRCSAESYTRDGRPGRGRDPAHAHREHARRARGERGAIAGGAGGPRARATRGGRGAGPARRARALARGCAGDRLPHEPRPHLAQRSRSTRPRSR